LKRLRTAVIVLSTLVFLAVRAGGAAASDQKLPEGMKKIRCTCYIEHGTTATGCKTREGIAAGRSEDLGKVAAIYSIAEDGSIGDFIGYYEFRDTGAGMDSDGDGIGDTIRTGKSIDVWQPSMDSAKAWIRKYGDYVYIMIIDAEG
jgi:3D (Asp-Asp-Asp) domain-containing protein